MSKKHSYEHPGFVVIEKTRTLIWEHISKPYEHPFVIYDPDAKPHLKSVSGPRPTSNYSYQEQSRGARASFKLVPSWLLPGIDQEYCDHIYQHLHEFDHVYLLGSGIGKWSGVDDFMDYVAEIHPHSITRFSPRRYFRFSDYSEKEALEIFHKMSAKSW